MQIREFNRYWREGHYVDLWSINHILSGVVLGAILFPLGATFGWASLVALLLFVGWEIAELMLGIKEHTPNMATDVLCDFLGYSAISYWFFLLGRGLSWTAILAWILLFIFMNIWGFIAYEARKVDEAQPISR